MELPYLFKYGTFAPSKWWHFYAYEDPGRAVGPSWEQLLHSPDILPRQNSSAKQFPHCLRASLTFWNYWIFFETENQEQQKSGPFLVFKGDLHYCEADETLWVY